MLIPVTKIQKFCTHDGPGVRTTVFLQGCPLRCAWCHNPETQSAGAQALYTAQLCIGCGVCESVCPEGAHAVREEGHLFRPEKCVRCGACAGVCPTGACEMSARDMDEDEILRAVCQDRAFYGEKGGMTLSGGEPMFRPEAAVALLRKARETGVHTAMETSGWFDGKWIDEIAPLTDLFLWDYKDSDSARHRRYTGQGNERILENLRLLDRHPVRIRLRCILVEGVNRNEAHLRAIAELYHSLVHCEGVDLLPYHTFGSSKNVQLGKAENAHPEWIPPEDKMEEARRYLEKQGVPVG